MGATAAIKSQVGSKTAESKSIRISPGLVIIYMIIKGSLPNRILIFSGVRAIYQPMHSSLSIENSFEFMYKKQYIAFLRADLSS